MECIGEDIDQPVPRKVESLGGIPCTQLGLGMVHTLLLTVAGFVSVAARCWRGGTKSRQNGAKRHQIEAERSRMAPNQCRTKQNGTNSMEN